MRISPVLVVFVIGSTVLVSGIGGGPSNAIPCAGAFNGNDDEPKVRIPMEDDDDREDLDDDNVHDYLNGLINEAVNAGRGAQHTKVLVRTASAVTQSQLSRFTALGGIVGDVWSYAVYGFHGKIAFSKIQDFASTQGVVFVSANLEVEAQLDFSVRQIRARPASPVTPPGGGEETAWAYGFTGDAKRSIAVLDTGIDDTHPDTGPFLGQGNFGGKIVAWKDFSGASTDVAGDEYGTPTDKNGHGTHVSSIAAGTGTGADLNPDIRTYMGVAPTSKLVGVKVLDDTGSGSFSDVIGGINWAIANKKTYNIYVISMSLGTLPGVQVIDDTVDMAVNNAVANGIVVVIAAGNDTIAGGIGSPGSAADAITIAANNDFDGITGYSSRGPALNAQNVIREKPDVMAPGGGLLFGTRISAADSNDANEAPGQNNYIGFRGTSMATPHTSGQAALVIQALHKQGLYPAPGRFGGAQAALFVKMLVMATAFETAFMTDKHELLPAPTLERGDWDLAEGYGRINADAATEAVTKVYKVGDTISNSFGPTPWEKKAWARMMCLQAGKKVEFRLSLPNDLNDYDLYVYGSVPGPNGIPNLVASQFPPVPTAAQPQGPFGFEERVSFTPTATGMYFLVVKAVDIGELQPAAGVCGVECTNVFVVTSAFT